MVIFDILPKGEFLYVKVYDFEIHRVKLLYFQNAVVASPEVFAVPIQHHAFFSFGKSN